MFLGRDATTSGRFSKRLMTSKNKKNHFSILTWTGRVVVPPEEGHQVPPLVAAGGRRETCAPQPSGRKGGLVMNRT